MPARRDRRLWLVLAIVALAKAILVVLITGPLRRSGWVIHVANDLFMWRADLMEPVAHGSIPYVDASWEYPPGAGLFYAAVTRLMDLSDETGMIRIHACLMGLIDLANVALAYSLLRSIAPRRAAFLALVFGLNLTSLFLGPLRYESLVTLCVLLGYREHRAGSPSGAAFYWALGSCLKWYPALFLAAQEYRGLVVEKRRSQWVRSTAVFAAVVLAFHLPLVWWDYATHHHFAHVLGTYRFHLAQSIHWDTVPGVLELWLGPLSAEDFTGLLTLVLVGLALLVRPTLCLEYRGALAIMAFLAPNRIYSTQFHLWFYPLLLLGLAAEGERRFRSLVGRFVALDTLNVIVFPIAFVASLVQLGHFAPLAARREVGPWTLLFTAAVLLRLAALVWMALGLVRAPGSSEATQGAADVEGAAVLGRRARWVLTTALAVLFAAELVAVEKHRFERVAGHPGLAELESLVPADGVMRARFADGRDDPGDPSARRFALPPSWGIRATDAPLLAVFVDAQRVPFRRGPPADAVDQSERHAYYHALPQKAVGITLHCPGRSCSEVVAVPERSQLWWRILLSRLARHPLSTAGVLVLAAAWWWLVHRASASWRPLHAPFAIAGGVLFAIWWFAQPLYGTAAAWPLLAAQTALLCLPWIAGGGPVRSGPGSPPAART